MPSAHNQLTEPNLDPHDQNLGTFMRNYNIQTGRQPCTRRLELSRKMEPRNLTKLPMGKSTIGCK
ncbi:hypothetical protein CK203_029163 [Vitis vinifera]|uniref:Uncharacterized protein n=1 Tax=Vitis vinifera TaxID=29760 RepID=A0A438ISY2_VITVI|nr:hypothetical protein CK203_029163 [Vitis vinifera]